MDILTTILIVVAIAAIVAVTFKIMGYHPFTLGVAVVYNTILGIRYVHTLVRNYLLERFITKRFIPYGIDTIVNTIFEHLGYDNSQYSTAEKIRIIRECGDTLSVSEDEYLEIGEKCRNAVCAKLNWFDCLIYKDCCKAYACFNTSDGMEAVIKEAKTAMALGNVRYAAIRLKYVRNITRIGDDPFIIIYRYDDIYEAYDAQLAL